MLEKVLGIARRLTLKNVLRIGLLLVTVVSVLTGFVFVDATSVAYSGGVYMAGGYAAEDSERFGLTELTVSIKEPMVAEIVDETTSEVEAIEVISDENAALIVLGMNANQDYIHQPLETEVTYETVTETVKHGYQTVYSDKLYIGETKTTKGQHGEKNIVYQVIMVNGVESSRVILSEEVTKEPVDQITTKGTKVKEAAKTSADVDCISTLKPSTPIALDKNGIPVTYEKVITGKASAYCNHCDSSSTAYFGPNTARPGYVAVNPKQIPYGTKLYIVSSDGKMVYGYAIAADTGGFAKNGDRVVDLRMHFDGGCRCGSYWGVRNVNIYVLGK